MAKISGHPQSTPLGTWSMALMITNGDMMIIDRNSSVSNQTNTGTFVQRGWNLLNWQLSN